jgi:thiosulfate dehydrogenase (quinone) large subunit
MASDRSRSLPLAAVMIVLGYEWLVSGLTKVVRGDFAGSLGRFLARADTGSAPWYRHFLVSTVIPHATVFGVLIETVELATGATLVVSAVALVTGRPARIARYAPVAGAAAALTGVALALNFKLLGGGAFAAPVAADSFDEGVDLDTMMVLLGVALAAALLAPIGRRALAQTVERFGVDDHVEALLGVEKKP